MSTSANAKYILIAALACVPAAAFANGMRLVSQDAFASARGEAFAATADNASAVHYNPAGITQLEGTQIRAGLYGIYFDPTFRPPAAAPNSANTYHVKNKVAAAPQFFLTHTPKDSRWSYGVGLFAPFGAGLTWPEDTGFRSVAIESETSYIRFNPVVAVKLTPQLSIAAGATINYAKTDLAQGLRVSPANNYFRFEGDGWSPGFNLGLLWQPHEKWSFGATFRSSTEVRFEGHTEIRLAPVIQPTRRTAEMDLQFPLTGVVGVSYRPTPEWNIEFNADYTDWSSFDTTLIRQQSPPFPVQANVPVNLNWQGSWLLGLGATRYLDNGWRASAGYSFNANSVPNINYTPLAADLDRHFVTIGAGKRGSRFDVDVTYQFGYGAPHTVTGSTASSQPGQFAGQNANGTYDFISHALLVTVGLRF